MYSDFAGREIEDLEMDNMRRDAREEATPLDLAALDATTIENFTAWVVEAIEDNPMDASTKQVVDALIQHSQRLRSQETHLKSYWTQPAQTLSDDEASQLSGFYSGIDN